MMRGPTARDPGVAARDQPDALRAMPGIRILRATNFENALAEVAGDGYNHEVTWALEDAVRSTFEEHETTCGTLQVILQRADFH